MKRQLEVVAGQVTDRGNARGRNEDFLGVPPAWVDTERLQTKGLLYLVADGMGGHAAGATASRLAVERTIQEYYSDPDPDAARSLHRAIRMANSAIWERAETVPSLSGMGSTLVAGLLRDDEFLVANVGDSRAYLVRGRSMRQISRDHTWVQEEVDLGTMTPEQADAHPKRNIVTRALGSTEDVRVDFFAERVQAGDTLFLCSDGVHGQVSDDEILDTLSKNRPQKAVKRLVALANERGGFDNSTAVAIEVLRTPSSVAPAVRRPRVAASAPMLGGIVAVVGVIMVMIAFTTLPRGPAVLATTTGTPATLSPADVVSPMATGVLPSTATATQSPPPPVPSLTPCPDHEGWVVYTLREGDTLLKLLEDKLCKLDEHCCIDLGQIVDVNRKANPGFNPDVIFSGEPVCLPCDPDGPMPTPTMSPTPTATIVPGVTDTATATQTSTPEDTSTATPTETTTPTPAIEGRIAFLCGPRICVMNVDDPGSSRPVTTVRPGYSRPAWSPNGQWIAFGSDQQDDQEIYVVNAEGGEPRRLTNSPGPDDSPAWSPDGKLIAFQSGRDGNSEIYVVNVDSEETTNLTRHPSSDAHPAWSPDQRHIAFVSNRSGQYEIYVMNADGSGQAKRADTPTSDDFPAWSPQGELIAFTRWDNGSGEIYVMNADGTNQLNLTKNPGQDESPAWSPDGRHIAFVSDRHHNLDIYVIKVDGGEATRLTDNATPDLFPAWGPRQPDS